jgi:glycosyltransferase involved in cell wall biosynthesis
MKETEYYVIGSSSSPDKGSGINAYAHEIVDELIRQGNNIIYVSPSPANRDWIESNGIKHVATERLNKQSDQALAVFKTISASKIKAIINNDNPILQSLAPVLKAPFINVAHYESRSIAALVRKNVNWVDYTIMISDDMRAKYVDKYQLPVEKCPIIYNGIKNRETSINGGTKSKRLSVVFSGGSNKYKGADLMLSAIKNNKERLSRFDIHWFGNVNNITRRLLERYSNVIVHDKLHRDDYISKMKEMDVFLMPSREEGCPMALLEAMSFELLPIVSNGRGAMRQVVQHGVDGYVVSLANWSSHLISILEFLNANREVLKAMSELARVKYLKEYTSQHTVNKLLSLIDRPTVDRSAVRGDVEIDVFKWHRLPWKGDGDSSFFEKLIYRIGHIRKESNIIITI